MQRALGGRAAGHVERADVEQLAGVAPVVQRVRDVDALVALKPDQASVEHLRQHFCQLGLADARLAFEQQRPLEEIHQPQRGRDVAIGDIADGGEAVGDVVAV
jgi:hypothetical protein